MAETIADPRLVWLGILAVTVLAAALRIPFLGHQSLWLDEIYTRDIISEPSFSGVWNHVQATESTPPLFYVLAWLFGGQSEVSMRLIPACSLIAAAPVTYFGFRRLVGEWIALAAAAIVAVSPELVWYSLDARAYGLFVLTGLLSVWGFSCLLECPSARRYLAWAAACVLCVWTHYFGFFLVAVEIIVLFAVRPDDRTDTLAWSAMIAVLLAPLLPLLLHQIGDQRAEFIAGIPLITRLTQTVRQFAIGANVPRAWLEYAGIAIAVGGLVGGVLVSIGSRSRSWSVLTLAGFAFGVPLLLAVLGIEDRFLDRNMLFVLPLAAALAALALVRLRSVPFVAYLLLAVVASVWGATNWRYGQADWRTVAARMKALDPAAAVIAVPQSQLNLIPAQAYIGRTPTTRTVIVREAWIVVEPYRAAHHRALGPAPLPGSIGTALPRFRSVRRFIVHGFRLILESASRPSPIYPTRIPDGAAFLPPL